MIRANVIMINTHQAASFVFEVTDRSRDLCNQYNATLCVLYKIENNDRPEITSKEKGKIPNFLIFFSPKIYTNVRKMFSLAVFVKTLLDVRQVTLNVVFEVASLRRWFHNSDSLNGTRWNLCLVQTDKVLVAICSDWYYWTSFSYILTKHNLKFHVCSPQNGSGKVKFCRGVLWNKRFTNINW